MTTTAPPASDPTRTTLVLTLADVRVGYRDASGDTRVLVEGLDLAAASGEMIGLWGRSGTGKSSLIRHLAGLTRPLSGSITLHGADGSPGTEIAALSSAALARYRREDLGYVDQSCELIPELSALDNATVWLHGGPSRLGRSARGRIEADARALLERLGLGHRLGARASRLSGGEAQRVALVRALAKRPRLIVADEPTGHLDEQAAGEVIAVLREHAAAGAAVLVASHDPLVHAAVDRAVRLGAD